MKLIAALCLLTAFTAHAKPEVIAYRGVDARALPCDVLVTDSAQGLVVDIHTRGVDARGTFTSEAEELTAQVVVYKSAEARAVVGLNRDGAFEIIALSAQGQRVECGGLEVR
jgi:hypothetical protein